MWCFINHYLVHFFILGYSHRTDSCHNKANTLVCHLLVFYILQKLLSFNKQFLKGEMSRRMQLFQPLKFQKISFFSSLKLSIVEYLIHGWFFLFHQIFHDFFKVPHSISAFKMALNFWMCCMENYVLEWPKTPNN